MAKTYYHNLTKGIFNENCLDDAVEGSSIGDVIKMSFRGNALMIDLVKEDLDVENAGEHDWDRQQFIDLFKSYHKKLFINKTN